MTVSFKKISKYPFCSFFTYIIYQLGKGKSSSAYVIECVKFI